MRKMMTASSKSHYSTKAGKCKPPKREFERRMKKGSRRGVLRKPLGDFLKGFLSALEIFACKRAYVVLMNVAVFIDISNLERF